MSSMKKKSLALGAAVVLGLSFNAHAQQQPQQPAAAAPAPVPGWAVGRPDSGPQSRLAPHAPRLTRSA